jgi:glycerol-3-phosphate dehydrogenase
VTAMSPASRAEAIRKMAETELDILVVGGGVVGAGSALDAVTRGLTTAIVEARDWASGTSSRSSKLIHGGLRYLEMLDFGLVREALAERGLLLDRIAPHLIRPVPFLYPLTHRVWERAYVGAGVLLYDTMAYASGTAHGLKRHRHLTRRRALHEAPCLRKSSFTGAIQYWDAQVDDARHTLTVARTAARYGAVVRASTRAVGFARETDRVVGVSVLDAEDGRETMVRAGVVLNCTGVWTDEIQALSGGRGRFRVRASKGIHIVVPREKITGDAGLILRTPTSVLFVIPWKNHWLIGTTDTDWNLDLAHPAATKSDIDYLLDCVNEVLVSPLTHDDIDGVYAGLRPLLAGESEETSALSREHAVARVVPGLISIAGGKYTTYRVMAADAVDAAAEELPRRVQPSCTDRVPLLGADGYFAMRNQVDALAEEYGLHPHRVRNVLNRYGSMIRDVLDPGLLDRALLATVPDAPDYLMAEIRYAVTHEGALHLEDVLTRRTRISIEYPHRGVACASAVADAIGDILGWDAATRTREVETYVDRVAAERASQARFDDEAADAVRTAAPEIRAFLDEPR